MEFFDKNIERYADVLLWGLTTARTGRFKRKDIVLIRFEKPALSLAEAIYTRLLDRGINAVPRMGPTWRMESSLFSKADTRQLVFVPPGEKEFSESLNGNIYLHAPESLTHLSDIDPKRIGTALKARKPMRDIFEKREASGDFGWTLCTYPTPELARQARISLKAYAEQVTKACFLDKEDPVREWKEIYKNAKNIKKWLNSLDVDYYHVESKNVDLKVKRGAKRKWIGISGHNIPSFELFVSPDWRGTEGIYYANQPTFRSGNYAEGVRLTFEKGAACSISADVGDVFVTKQLSIDRGANKIGEFSLTDKRFSRIDKFMADTLYDENYGGMYGNCHIAVGASYLDTYDGDPAHLTGEMKKKLGFNDSALHWDLVNTEEKTVTAHLNGGKKKVIYEKGIFSF